VITKSGSNDWHGSLFHRYEGSALSARQPILRTKPNAVWNQFGGSLGGPIRPDKAFFFFAYEGYRQRTATALTNSVPTQRFRDSFRQYLPFPETDVWLKYYPLPNQPHLDTALLAQWIGPGISQQNDDHVDTKLDYLVGGGNFSLTFTGGHPSQIQEDQQPLNPRTYKSKIYRANAAYVIGRGSWTSSTRVAFSQQVGHRIEQFFNEKDPHQLGSARGVPAIMYTGMTAIGRRGNRKWGLIPGWSAEQQFSVFRGAHSLKFGGKLDLRRGGTIFGFNSGVSFQTLDDVMRNTPSSVSPFFQANPNLWSMNNFGFYLQDDWRLNRKLVLNLGLRYDRFGTFHDRPQYDDLPTGLFNLDGLLDPVNFTWGPLRDADSPFKGDNLNLGPRIGFAYSADSDGDFVVRGGFGVNFAGYDGSNFESSVGRRPDLPVLVTFSRAEAVAFGLKYPAYNEDMEPLMLNPPRGARPDFRYDPNLRPPYAMNYTLSIQKALTPTLLFETGFVGSRGVKFNLHRTFNPVDRITGLRPNPNDIQGDYLDNSQQTNYNSWQTSLKQRLTRNLSFNVNYTWGKALSYSGGDVAPAYIGDSRLSVEDFTNIKIERSLSTGDVTHNMTIDWVYLAPTPFRDSPIARHILGDWQFAGIWKGQTGQPLSVTQTGGRPDLVALETAVNKNCCSFGNLQYLNPAAFSLVTVPTISGRTIRRGHMNSTPLRGPGIWNFDFSMGKDFRVTEQTRLDVRADMLNAFNHTQYTGIATNMSGLVFGQAISTAPARAIQVQMRLLF
jgi:hypothetical protein